MAITDLIAQGGTNVPSPVDRYIQGRDFVGQLRARQQESQLRQQQIGLQQQKAQIQQQQEMRARGEEYAKTIAPILKQISDLPEDQRQPAYQQVLPQFKQEAQKFGLPVENISPAWDEQKAKMVVDRYFEPEKGKFVNAELNGKIVPAVETEEGELVDPQTREPLVGAIKAPNRQAQDTAEGFGLKDSTKSKIKQQRIEAEQDLYRHVSGLDYIGNLISSDEFVGGTMGDVISLANSAAAQVRQVTGADSIIKNGKVDTSQIDPDSEELSRLRKAAINQDSYEAALIELAYIKAKQVDPAAKITDKDFAFARKMLGAGADKASLLNVIKNERERAIQNFNKDEAILGRREQYQPVQWNEDIYRQTYGKQQNGENQDEIDSIVDEVFDSNAAL